MKQGSPHPLNRPPCMLYTHTLPQVRRREGKVKGDTSFYPLRASRGLLVRRGGASSWFSVGVVEVRGLLHSGQPRQHRYQRVGGHQGPGEKAWWPAGLWESTVGKQDEACPAGKAFWGRDPLGIPGILARAPQRAELAEQGAVAAAPQYRALSGARQGAARRQGQGAGTSSIAFTCSARWEPDL